MGQSRRRAGRCHTGLFIWAAVAGLATGNASGATFGGDITAATDYIFRGVSQNDGHPAAQFDVHAGTDNGYFAGVWGSTLDRRVPRTNYEFELYAGKRFELSSEWNTSLTAVDYSYVQPRGSRSYDYQELAASLSYLDTLTVAISASPNAVRYRKGYWFGRNPAYDANVTAQWPIVGALFITGGAGYYYLAGPGPEPGTSGYAYGNAGLALEWRAWRLDVGYFFAEYQAQELFPYAKSGNRVAATLNWRF